VSLSDEIKRSALEAGFDLAGIAPVDAAQDLEFARTWVEKGCGGEMEYLRNPKRRDPRLILPSAKSVVCVGLVYNADLPYSTQVRREASGSLNVALPESGGNPQEPEGPRGWISRYAWGLDYHRLMRERLERLRAAIEHLAPGVETRVSVDTGPIVERAFARLSGIGWVGKNTCLIHQQKGSWFFLGVILTSLMLEPDQPAFDRCGSCRRCLEACPTAALTQPYVMDASRCLAYFNIELKGSIPERFRPAMGANVFGCDICQDVCPWNRNSGPATAASRHQAATTTAAEFQPLTVELNQPGAQGGAASESLRAGSQARPFSLFHPRLSDLAALTEADFRRIFAHSPIKRVKHRGWLRNLCVVIANTGDARFVPWLGEMSRHEDAVVKEHAEWALARLRATGETLPPGTLRAAEAPV
jgi:epoxyqueuosine reductase